MPVAGVTTRSPEGPRDSDRCADDGSLITAAGVLSGSTVVLATWWLPAALASGLVALTTAVGGVRLARGTQLVTAPGARLPLVRDLDDPVALGVHRAAGQAVPAFIARDVTERLHEALRRDRFVLIVGESTGWDIIRLATRVDLGRSWSGDELSRAREHVSDPRIADALAHAADFGVAEYLAARGGDRLRR